MSIHTSNYNNSRIQAVLLERKQQVNRSWERSKAAGIETNRCPDIERLTKASLKNRRDEYHPLLVGARQHIIPVFSHVIKSTGSRVMLCDNDGVILDAWGSDTFLPVASRVALEAGVCWNETKRGTNAIGTSLAEEKPSIILGEDHYLEPIRIVSCAASPIYDGQGQVLGVVDVSAHSRDFHKGNFALAEIMAARMENQMLLDAHQYFDCIKLYSATNLNSMAGLLFFDQGQLIAANHAAFQLLEIDLTQHSIGFDDLFIDTKWFSQAEHQDIMIQSAQGEFFYARFQQAKSQPKPVASVTKKSKTDKRVIQAEELALLALNKNIPLMIQGQTGVGKEHLVQTIHQASKLKNGPLITINCAAIPEALVESELFGYAAGAFTGASRQGMTGKIREAQGGILFLDEVADLSLDTQAKLLRVLQEKTVTPLGTQQSYYVDFSLICASHKPLKEAVEQGLFREDLYYRINAVEVLLPALKEREDFDQVVQQMLATHDPDKTLADDLLQRFRQYSWPGNIRQLDHLLQIAAALSSDESVIQWHHLPENLQHKLNTSTAEIGHELDDRVTCILAQTWRKNQGNISRTAKELGISRNTLYRRLRKAGLLEADNHAAAE